MAEATKNDLFNVFGRNNVKKWADLDNDKNETTTQERIDWALATALDYIYTRIRGRYFTSVPFANTPRIIIFMNCLYAGILLYDGRSQNVSTESRDEISRHRKQFKSLLRELLSGQMHLVDGLSGELIEPNSRTFPTVENSSYSAYTCYCGVCHTCVQRSLMCRSDYPTN